MGRIKHKKKSFKQLAKLERSIPTINGDEILFWGDDTGDLSKATKKEKKIIKSKLKALLVRKSKKNKQNEMMNK